MVVKSYKCDVCGKTEPWGPSWRWKFVLRGKCWDRWEEDVHVCSDECARQWDKAKTLAKKVHSVI